MNGILEVRFSSFEIILQVAEDTVRGSPQIIFQCYGCVKSGTPPSLELLKMIVRQAMTKSNYVLSRYSIESPCPKLTQENYAKKSR